MKDLMSIKVLFVCRAEFVLPVGFGPARSRRASPEVADCAVCVWAWACRLDGAPGRRDWRANL